MLKRIFIAVYQFFCYRKRWIFAITFSIVILCLALAFRLSFEEDISSFLPNSKENEQINYAYQHLGNANTIIISVEKKDDNEEDLTQIIDDLTLFFKTNDTCQRIKKIHGEINQEDILSVADFIMENMPYFLSETDYARMDSIINPQYINNQLSANKLLLATPEPTLRNILIKDPLHFCSSALENLVNFRSNEDYEMRDGYLFRKKDDAAILFLTPSFSMSETANNALLVQDIENAISSISEKYKNVNISAFGTPLISVTNAQQIKKDSFISVFLALILILLLLVYYFRNVRSLFWIMISISFGALFAIGLIAIIDNHISLIAMGISSIIFGIAVNYPLHFLAHAKHESNIKQVIADIVNPLLIGNITTIGAFLSLLFISSPAMKDMGLLAALILFGTILFVLIVLPHCIKQQKKKDNYSPLVFDKLSKIQIENNKFIVILVLLLTVVFYYFSFQTRFDSNMHAINYMTKEQKINMQAMTSSIDTNSQSIYLVCEGKTPDEALQNYEMAFSKIENLQKEEKIISYSGIGHYLPSKAEQQAAIDRWNLFWENKRENFCKTFDKIAQNNGYQTTAFNKFKSTINADYQVQEFDFFRPLIQNLAENYLSIEKEKTLIYCLLQIDKNKIENTKSAFENQENIFFFDNASFLDRMINALSKDFDKVLYICAFIVFAFLLYSFGRIELALISFVPLLVAWIWILGLMGIFGLKFNIVNIILATFIFGQGDDYTIFVTEGLMYEYRFGKQMLAKFKSSIILSSVIMFVGIGTLIFAKHPAMHSLAEVTIVGMISVVLMAYLFPPLLYKMLTIKKKKQRKYPITLIDILRTIYVYIIVIVLILIVYIVGFSLLTIGGKTQKHKKVFHQLLCGVFRCLLKLTPFNKFHVYDKNLLNEKKSQIIIANHQSIVDIVVLLALMPNLVVFVNDWVWKSPIFGKIIRYADFLKIDSDILSKTDHLSKLVENGYSIVIFPEATRSIDYTIGNFHKGAFYLAQQLNLDIQPIILHGTGHMIPKHSLLIRKFCLDVKILPTISTKTSPMFNHEKLFQTAKNYRTYLIEQYNLFAREIETTNYWKNFVLHNYLYKGREVEQQAKKRMKQFDNFQKIVELLPQEGSLFIQNCKQGELSLLVALCRPKLTIYAFDINEDDMQTAKNCAANPNNLIYSVNENMTENADKILSFNPSEEQLKNLKTYKQETFILTNEFSNPTFETLSLLVNEKHYKIYKMNL